MFFNSITYLLFFPAVWLVYQFTPDRLRWLVLLLASVVFYAALNAPILLLSWIGVVAVSYYCAFGIARQQDDTRRKRVLWFGVSANFLVLVGVKYLRVFVERWSPGLVAESSTLFLTIGVSYFTLQAVSYLVDVYLETEEPERHFGYFALYLAFFPKMLQGPIERAGDLLPQLKATYEGNYENLRSGLLLFGWGLFKKVAVANRIAPYVNAVYNDVDAYSGVTLIAATYLYAFQILADFSGYTDMALGVARMFNIRLTQNFNSPYLATSIADFWRRWHISFSRWILDYVFKPLQIQWRVAETWGTAAALLVTFVFSGLWHGASWNFVLWGLLHGVFLSSSVLFKNRILQAAGLHNYPLRRVVQTVVTFNLVAFAWIFFRANSLSDALYVVTHLFIGVPEFLLGIATAPSISAVLGALFVDRGGTNLALMVAAVSLLCVGTFLKNRMHPLTQPLLLRWTLYYGLIIALAYLAVYDDVGFVYFQF